MMDLRATGATTAGAGVVDSKNVVLSAPGDTVTLGLFAKVTGTDGVNNEQMQSIFGLVNSVGAAKGNMSGGYVPAFFTAGVSQNGSVLDWDSDGDLDIGLSPTNSSGVGKFAGRSTSPTPMPSLGGAVLVGEFVWTVTDASGSFDLNFTVRSNNGNNLAQTALWFEDGSTISKNPTNSPITVGPPVTWGPEPSSLSAVVLTGIGLLNRRHRGER